MTTTMPLAWSDALALDVPAMDDTHREFVDLLATVSRAEDADLLDAWSALIAHTEAHFGREDAWMKQTGFASTNCHATQHAVVLRVLKEGQALGAVGRLGVIRQMAEELADWFPSHAQTMDAALALHLRSAGFDPATGEVAFPENLPAVAVTGCGSASCGG